MDVVKDHIIHSEGGRLGAGASSREHAQRIAAQAYDSGCAHGIVLHIHGGLVKRSYAEKEIAPRLARHYADAGTYPIIPVWESGFIEAIQNNLRDILQDKVFHELLKKTSEWVLKKSGGEIATRGAGGMALDTHAMRKDYDLWLNGQTEKPPVRDVKPAAATLKGAGPDEDELARAIEDEIELDDDFAATLAGLAAASKQLPAIKTKGGKVAPRAVNVLVDQGALDELFPPADYKTKGLLSWLTVAKFVAKVVMAVLRRYKARSDHGAYTTIVEEVLRAAYLDKVGQVIWNQMKKDAEIDSFNGPDAVGDVILNVWKEKSKGGGGAPRITLIGHSTGALAIIGWLERSAELTPDLKYDVILLAPACRTEKFMKALDKHAARINNFRLFGMRDENEQKDKLVPVIYPRSLLYFVSGVVEGDVDVPLLGMERYVLDAEVFSSPYMSALRKYFDHPSRTVWSVNAAGVGLGSSSLKHGDFDNDPETLASLAHIIKSGY